MRRSRCIELIVKLQVSEVLLQEVQSISCALLVSASKLEHFEGCTIKRQLHVTTSGDQSSLLTKLLKQVWCSLWYFFSFAILCNFATIAVAQRRQLLFCLIFAKVVQIMAGSNSPLCFFGISRICAILYSCCSSGTSYCSDSSLVKVVQILTRISSKFFA